MSNCKRCTSTCGDRKSWPTSGCCSCRCHEYGVDGFEPLNMMPARDGDRALYLEDYDDQGKRVRQYCTEPIAMWALGRVVTEWRHPNDHYDKVRRREVRREIVGMVFTEAGVESAEQCRPFSGYLGPGDPLPELPVDADAEAAQ